MAGVRTASASWRRLHCRAEPMKSWMRARVRACVADEEEESAKSGVIHAAAVEGWVRSMLMIVVAVVVAVAV